MASTPLLSKVKQLLNRLGLQPGGMVVAVSGGPDSMALLHALLALRQGTEPLILAHLNHQLRGAESEADEHFVGECYAHLRARGTQGLELRCARVDVAAQARQEGGNLESVARRLRYDWLAGLAREASVSLVATGHTADDQAETVLHRLLRGTGLKGLRGIAPRRTLAPGVELVRPLLDVRRSEVLAYLEREGQTYRQDSSNEDRDFTRNRIRHELLPQLAREYNPEVVTALTRLGEQAAEVYRHQEGLATKLLTDAELPRAGHLLIFDPQRLSAAPRQLLRDVFHQVWFREAWSLESMGFREWDRLAAVVLGEITAVDLPGGIHARLRGRVVQVGRRTYDALRCCASDREDPRQMNLRKIERALLSVSDKTGLVDFARILAEFGVELTSTGGTRKVLEEAGLKVLDISQVTGFPEILDGRVKTLHPHVYGGILAVRDNPQHQATLQVQGIKPIDIIVCNLYPFETTVARPGSTHEEVVENIDIGGPTMVRAAAKNYHDVAMVTAPAQYAAVVEELQTHHGALTLATRQRLAAAAFARTAAYDRAIRDYFVSRENPGDWPPQLDLHLEHRLALRYGENPHQKAAFYVEPDCRYACVSTAESLHGKELSFNNILDLDSALNLVREFTEPAAVVIKHNNPCGASVGETLEEAFRKAYEGDPLSAYGGVLGFNREVDEATATQITEPNRFVECVIAPEFSEAAFRLLTTRPTWKKSVRLLRTGPLDEGKRAQALDYRRVDGGLLVQTRDGRADDFAQLRTVTKRAPTPEELADLRFAWLVCKHVKSNAIVLAKGGMLVGVGAGQMSRVDSVHLAVRKAGERSRGSVLASDAFFPFRDNIDEAAKAGATAVVQPGGSMRDQDSIQACDELGLAMVLTGVRHFRH
jgi:phosphoribosylaminoimidazolecarboxamide formyltransferase/IMP cyclohydrolase